MAIINQKVFFLLLFFYLAFEPCFCAEKKLKKQQNNVVLSDNGKLI